MTNASDVAIIGGGGMGSATAYFLRRLGGAGLKVAVFEPDPTYARASTVLAAGGIRQQFSTRENILMSQFGYAFLEAIGDALSVDDERPSVGLTPRPYLRLVGPARREELRRDFDLQLSLGARPTWLEPGDLARRYPWLKTDDVAAAVLGGPGEGMFDPYGMLQAFRRKNQALGVSYHAAEVAGFELGADGRTVIGLKLSNGEVAACGVAVNAAGPRAAKVASLAGLDLPVAAIKAHSFAVRAPDPLPDCPIVLDQILGVQFKPERDLFVCAAPGGEVAVDENDFNLEPDLFESEVWPRLATRAPRFESLRLLRGWVGHVELNRFDANPILGLHPDRPNLYFINGFSGHGAQHVPAAGRAVAELILHGGYRSLDLSRFGYERILRQSPVREGV